MLSSKHQASEHSDQPSTKSARTENTDSQHINQSPSNPIETFGNFRIEIRLRSISKAARNDPVAPPPQSGPSRKLLSDCSKGNSTTEENLITEDLAIQDPSSGNDVDETSIQAKRTPDDSGPGIPYDHNSAKNIAVGTERTKIRGDEKESREDNAVIDTEDEQEEWNEEDDDEFEIGAEDYQDDCEDEDRSEYDPDYVFEWLEPIDVIVTSTATLDDRGEPETVAHCQAKLIRRNQIRNDFYEQMEQPSRETSMLAFDLFNRYGRLSSEFKSHPVIKGTGIWGQEVDNGDMLLIEEHFVKKDYRRQRVGQRMIESLLVRVQQKSQSCFAFVWPTVMRVDDLELEWDSLEDDEARTRMEDREHDSAVMFYRSMGFRRVGSTIWFAMAFDDDHPSRQLTSTEDFDPPKAPLTALHPLLSPFEQLTKAPQSDLDQMLNPQPHGTPDFLGVLKNGMEQKGANDACWLGGDKHGNTVLHIAASGYHAACVDWILNQAFGPQLLQLRNNRGETPIELLKFKLGKLRTQRIVGMMTVHLSDRFEGHNDGAVFCLTLLEGLGSVESITESGDLDPLLRIARGCTCGQCLKGFLSPRMSHALLCQAEMGYNMLNEDMDQSLGPEWVDWHEHYFGYLPSRVLNNLRTNNSMRQGFANLWRHIATCLETKRVPSASNVLDVVGNASEWPPATTNFLRRGTVESVFLAICRCAIEQDEWAGDGEHQEIFGEDIARLPECRNDHEFGYVSGMCGYRRISLSTNVDMMGNHLDESGNIIDSRF